MELELRDSWVLVTGASSGIGRACAISAAQEGGNVLVGYHVDEVAARDTVAAVEALDVRGVALRHDLGDPEGARSFGSEIARVTPKLAAVIHCAVAWPDRADDAPAFETLDADTWRSTISTNLIGTMALAASVLPLLLPDGRMVLMSSTMADDGARGAVAYSAAKSALVGLCRSLALEHGGDGLLINVVMPGLTDTDRQRASRAPELLERVRASTPSRRISTPDGVAAISLFLASPANTNTNGQVVRVDGRW